MIYQTYYDLISEDLLPPSAYLIDPYDLTAFSPQPHENLTQLINRFESNRKDKDRPQIVQTDLKRLVVDSLYETTPHNQRAKYFQEVRTPPNLTQVYSFIRTTAQTLARGQAIPPAQRENRAQHCLSCDFHSKSRSWSKPFTKAVSKLVGIHEATTSESEKSLGSCLGCGGCALQPKVGYSVQSVIAGLNPDQIDVMLRRYGNKLFSKCWMFEEALNDPSTSQLVIAKISHLGNNTARAVNAIQYIQSNKKKAA